MTPEEMLRAIAYIQAVNEGDDDAMTRLDEHAYGQLSTRHLLVQFFELMLRAAALLEAAADEAPPQERRDLAAALSGVLLCGVREWAETAQENVGEDGTGDFTHASEGIARTIANFLLVTTDGPPGELTPRLEALRTTAAEMVGPSAG